MASVLIKVCGLTREQDVKAAVELGVDAVGFVFTKSPRQITANVAVELSRWVPEGVTKVGLFLDQSQSEIDKILSEVSLDLLQFHGQESAELCRAFPLPYLKAVSMQNSRSLQQALSDYPDAEGLLLDSHVAGQQGGSGKVFDWSVIEQCKKPIWLAGGLNPGNVATAIEMVAPYAVDVSSGVESSPGIKSVERIKAFVDAVRQQNH
jgi:phosphoribosylanthranilate isomerase